ncbi:LOW QUALITY PROTEIN: uncharacterized protein MYH16 [Cariama cristata]
MSLNFPAPSCGTALPQEECVDDADPMQFLAPPEKQRTEAMNKPYDIKTSCWVKDEQGGFLAGEIQSKKDDKVMVKMVMNQLSPALQVQQESRRPGIIQVNPVLESLDNVKAMRKNNSSHFVAFDVLGSSPEERICVYKLTMGMMHLGTMKFKQKPRIEQAEVEKMEVVLEPRPLMATEGCHYNHPGKPPNLLKPRGGKGKGEEAHFEHVVHYVGTHGITGQLQKNEDALNEAVVGLLQKCSMPLLWVLCKEKEAAHRVNITRYQSLNPSIISPGSVDNKKASELLLCSTDLGEKEYRVGCSNSLLSSDILFCAGILAALEGDKPLAKIMTMLQGCAHRCLMRIEYRKMLERRLGLMANQRNVQKFLQLLFWGGWKLYIRVGVVAAFHRMNTGFPPLLEEQENLLDAEECLAQMMKSKMDLLSQILDRKELTECQQVDAGRLLSDLKCDLEGLEATLAKTEKEKQALDHRVRTLTSDLSVESVTTFQKEKRALEEVHQPEDYWEQEKKIYAKVKKVHHKADLKMTQSSWRSPRVKVKLETDKQVTKTEMDDLSTSMESLRKSKLSTDAHIHRLEDNLSEANARLADREKSQAEINAMRLQVKTSQLSCEHEEAQSRLNQIACIKISLTLQADDFQMQLEEESKSCAAAVVSLANTKHDLHPMKELEEEEESIAELRCLVSKLNTEVKIRYRTDATERTKELEETKTKLAVRLQKAEETAESVQAWVANIENTKQGLQNKTEDLTVDLEKANAACTALDKKQRVFDKMLAERQQKCRELQVEGDSFQTECTTENFELKIAYEESFEYLKSMNTGNKALQEEIKDLINQLGEGGKSIHKLKRQRLEIEKDELQVALEEAVCPRGTNATDAEESKLICSQLKVAQVEADTDRHEKEEFETSGNNHQHATRSLQASLETEADAEALRLKKMDTDLISIEMQLDYANRNNSELVRTLNKLQQHIKINWRGWKQTFGSKRLRMLASTRSHRSSTCHLCLLQSELEEAQTGLGGSKYSRKLLEQAEAMERHNELNVRLKELEIELDSKQKCYVETQILHKNKRPLKEPEDEANQSLAIKKTLHELDDAEEREEMAESALNKLHTRHCVSASKGLASGEVIQVPQSSSCVSLAGKTGTKMGPKQGPNSYILSFVWGKNKR